MPLHSHAARLEAGSVPGTPFVPPRLRCFYLSPERPYITTFALRLRLSRSSGNNMALTVAS